MKFVLLCLPIIFIVAWGVQPTWGVQTDSHSGSVQEEIFDLESKRKSKFLMSQAERLHLASLYFLISDCGKVNDLLRFDHAESAQQLSCACEGVCDVSKHRPSSDLYLLRELFRGNMDFRHSMVQEVWNRVRDNPFAQFVVLENLINSNRIQDQKLVAEISQNLEAFHVK